MNLLEQKRIFLLGLVQSIVFLVALYAFTFGYTSTITSPEIIASPIFHLALVVASGWLFVIAVVIYMLNSLFSIQAKETALEEDSENYRDELEAVKAAKKDTEREYYRREIDEQSFKEAMREYYRKINELKNKLDREK